MATDETAACANFHTEPTIVSNPTTTQGSTRTTGRSTETAGHIDVATTTTTAIPEHKAAAPEETNNKQPTPAAAAAAHNKTTTATVSSVQPTNFVGNNNDRITTTTTTTTTKKQLQENSCSLNDISSSNNSPDYNGNQQPQAPIRSSKLASKNSRSQRGSSSSSSSSSQKQHQNQQAAAAVEESQSRINHSLESINSKYSTSSANDDSTISMHQQQQQHCKSPKHQQQQQHKLQPNQQSEQSLRHRLSSIVSVGCSPIEAQLASSTCDLGINLVDSSGWRGSFSSIGLTSPLSSPTPTREPAKSLVAFISLADTNNNIRQKEHRRPNDHDDDDKDLTATTNLPDRNGKNSLELNNNNNNLIAGNDGPKPPFMFAGVLASIVGSVFFSLSVLCIKLLPNREGFSETVKALCFRGVFVSILCGVAILIQRSTFIVRRDELLVNILRATFGTFGVLGLYSALSYISMGDATALIFSSPVWTSILSHFILKEPLQWLQLIALPASLFGIVLIAHPGLIVDVEHINHHQQQQQQHAVPLSSNQDLAISGNITATSNVTAAATYPHPTNSSASNQSFSISSSALLLPSHQLDLTSTTQSPLSTNSFDFDQRWPGIVIALATSLLVSCVYIALKFRKTTPIQTTTFWFGIFMIVASLAIQCVIGPIDIPFTVYEWSLLFGNGVTSWLGQSFLQWAFLYEEAGVLSIVRTLDVAMTFVLSALFLDEEILWTSIVGATIIGLVVVSIMLNEWIKKLSCTQRKNSVLEDDHQHEVPSFVGLQNGAKEGHQFSLSMENGTGEKGTKNNIAKSPKGSGKHHSKQSAYSIASKA